MYLIICNNAEYSKGAIPLKIHMKRSDVCKFKNIFILQTINGYGQQRIDIVSILYYISPIAQSLFIRTNVKIEKKTIFVILPYPGAI